MPANEKKATKSKASSTRGQASRVRLSLALVLLLLSVPHVTEARVTEHHGTKRIPGLISSHLQPTTFRSGIAGKTIRWHSTVCNLSKQAHTWPVKVTFDRPVATADYPSEITVPAGTCFRGDLQLRSTFTAGPGDDETWMHVTTGPLTVERTITRCPCTHHPRLPSPPHGGKTKT